MTFLTEMLVQIKFLKIAIFLYFYLVLLLSSNAIFAIRRKGTKS